MVLGKMFLVLVTTLVLYTINPLPIRDSYLLPFALLGGAISFYVMLLDCFGKLKDG
jgi:hypothetical protein